MKSKRAANPPLAVLDNVAESLGGCLTETSAQDLLALRPSLAARRRMARLAIKCDEGMLTPDERAEYRYYVDVGDFIALLQAKARRLLAAKANA